MIVGGVEEVADRNSAAALDFAAREANRRRLPVNWSVSTERVDGRMRSPPPRSWRRSAGVL
jgi:hypothetical protein